MSLLDGASDRTRKTEVPELFADETTVGLEHGQVE
jgi:hypothetical protein